MARVKLTEYRAKSLLIAHYRGVEIHLSSLESDVARLDADTSYVVKVDQGIKKRGKQGLIRLDVMQKTVIGVVRELAEKGFERFIAEPMLSHEDTEERYVSIERVRGGMRIVYSPMGGVDIEEHPESIKTYQGVVDVPLPQEFLRHIVKVMDREHLSFVEINPLVVRGDECVLLDAAVLADSAGVWQASWTSEDVVEAHKPMDAEQAIADLNDSSTAAFSFRVSNPDGSIWLQMMGGGASITIADEAMNQGRADEMGCFGEYSGGPVTEEVYLYTTELVRQMLASKAPKKALVIAGGVANFSDVQVMFRGVIQALMGQIDDLKRQNVRVYVRRGGPNEREGLALMEAFLRNHGIYGSVHGSNEVLTTVVNEALEYVDA